MQVLFCHDGPLRVDDNGSYYGISHNDEMFKRYFSIANKIATVIRVRGISPEESTKSLSEINISPFKVYEIPNIKSVKGIFKRKKAKKIIENAVLESDYIVARMPSTAASIAIDFAKKHHKPYITEVVACPWDSLWNHSLKGKVLAPYSYYSTRKKVKESKYVVYVTNKFLQRRYPTKGESLNCSDVTLTEFDESILQRRLKKIKEKKEDEKIIIGTTAAVNVRYKGQQYIIKALGELKKQGQTNYEYQLVGSGDQSYLRSIAKKYNVVDQVKFLGPLPHNKIFDWLESIDIYTQPSRQEGLPRALIESFSRGLPAFGARTGGIPELLEDDFIFSNTRKNIDEICNILMNFDIETMKEQSIRNFEEAKKYDKKIIDHRREKFFKKFKDFSD